MKENIQTCIDGATNLLSLEKGRGQFAVFENHCPESVTEYSRHNYYNIMLTKIRGKLIYGKQTIQIDKPCIIFLNPLIPYSGEIEWAESTTPTQICVFSTDFIDQSLQKSILQDSPFYKEVPHVLLTEDQYDVFFEVFERMKREFNSDFQYKYEMLYHYLSLIILYAIKEQSADKNKLYNNAALRITSEFIDLLERQFPIISPQAPLSLKTAQEYAGKLAIHTNHLNRSVKEVLNRTTTDVITDRIIQEAKSLLQYTDWSISDISHALGFEYTSYFNNFFKKHTEQTPSSFKVKIV